MKIGILTLPLHTNYGGIIQAYAMQTVLEQLGHEAEQLVTKFRKLPWFENQSEEEIGLICSKTDRFIDKYIHGDSWDIPKDNAKGYEAIVVGSDQVWSPFFSNIMLGGIRNSFLDFAKDWDIRRVAYSASFGQDSWNATEEETADCRKLAARFNAVGVREESGVTLCRDHFGVAAKHVLDPTMLLRREDYNALIEAADTQPVSSGTLMNYVLDKTEEKKELVSAIERAYGLTTMATNSRVEDASAPIEERIQPPLEQWLKSFRDAEMVVTDSFHATVFSIIFGKRFIITGNPFRGMARITSLLGMLGLEDHFVMNASQLDSRSDYSIPGTAFERLEALREDSLSFLKKALE